MTTWHQAQALKRHYKALQDAGKPITNPFEHDTQWTVVEDPPGRMASAQRFDSRQAAQAHAEAAHHRWVVPPRSLQ